ncbi:L,D-transpeptidase family protein [Neptuniibacter sp.]|uniref:L,D-transpeptidase family protein n=1 Tax=Neptuniibacter sp. TaxID=1962643 RepID=UPI003B5A5A8B
MFQIKISIADQTLKLMQGDQLHSEFLVSTALNGAGETNNSGCTPRGDHYIRAMIGEGLPLNAVFVGRRFTGEIYNPNLAEMFPERDWILTRIMWLCGTEIGKNRLGHVDSMQRYIYIHGTPDPEPMGVAKSHGCIRMRNTDLVSLFELVTTGTPVSIEE